MLLLKLRKLCFFCLFFGFVSNAAYADAPESFELQSKLIRANGLLETLNLSLAFIDREIATLPQKKLKLSKKELNNIKQQLLARYHPNTLEYLLLNKLKSADSLSTTQLLEFYQSAPAIEIHDLRAKYLRAEHQSELLEYQKKLESLPAQSHRRKLTLIVDRLNQQSDWQAVLLFNIQQSLFLLLPEKTQENYLLSQEETLLNDFIGFNNIINMYSLKHVSSEQLIHYLDSLNEHKPTLNTINHAFREVLQEQQALQLTLED